VTDPRLDAVLQPALGRIRGVVSGVLDQAVVQLSTQAAASASNLQRQLLMTDDRELRLKGARLKQCFERELNALVDGCLQSNPDTSPNSLANTDWASLSLVDNAQVERDVQADRLALTVTHACERPLEAVASYIAGLALSHARLGVIHGLAHPLGVRFHAAHGLVCACCLPACLAFNRDAVAADLGALKGRHGIDIETQVAEWLAAMNVASPFKGGQVTDREAFIRETLGVFTNMTEQTFSGVFSTASKDTQWLSLDNYAALVCGNAFESRDIVSGKKDVFLNIPASILRS